MTRPWRLTRRERVAMEAALAGFRGGKGSVHAGFAALGVCSSRGSCFCAEADAAVESRRILRARVAIALRAALRADEDARCEEASRKAIATEGVTGWRGREVSICVGVWALAEWPLMYAPGRVPLALWERRPSLWAASPPTSGGPRDW